jgi:hypothetical protein
MVKKWVFAAGAAVGYLLGTRAGREKYDRMAEQARQLLDQPKVKEVQNEATRLYEEGKVAVRDKMRKLSDRNGYERDHEHTALGTAPAPTSTQPTSPTQTSPTLTSPPVTPSTAPPTTPPSMTPGG